MEIYTIPRYVGMVTPSFFNMLQKCIGMNIDNKSKAQYELIDK